MCRFPIASMGVNKAESFIWEFIMPKKSKELKPLIPPDTKRCQAEHQVGAFVLGGRVGEKTRCENKPSVIATEKKPGKDGRKGSMSLCAECLPHLIRQFGDEYARITEITEAVVHSDKGPS